MNQNNRTSVITITLVVLLLGSMVVLSRKKPKETTDPVWTILKPPSDVTTMVDAGDVIWIGGKEGVMGLIEETHEVVEFQCEQRLTYTRNMLWEDGVLWIGHDRGLTRWTEDGWYTYTEEDGMVTDRVNWVMRDIDGTLWVGTWHGAYYNEGSGWDRLTTSDGLINNNVHTIRQHSSGDIWFGSYTTPEGGISIMSETGWTYFSTENGLIHNNIVHFFEDTDGSMWASTGLMTVGAGIHFKIEAGKWVIADVLTSEEGIPNGKVRSIYRDTHGILWVGSEDEGLALIDEARIRIVSINEGLSQNEVKVYLEDKYGNLWLGTRDGVTILTRENISNIN